MNIIAELEWLNGECSPEPDETPCGSDLRAVKAIKQAIAIIEAADALRDAADAVRGKTIKSMADAVLHDHIAEYDSARNPKEEPK